MRFEEAIKELKKGKKIKRPNHIYLVLNGKFIVNEYGGYDLLLNSEDLFAEDWEVVEDDNKGEKQCI